MLFDLVDTLQKKRRLLFVVAFISIDFWLLTFFCQVLQTHRSNIAAHIHTSELALTQVQYQNGALTSGTITDSMGHLVTVLEIRVLRTTVSSADGITKAEHGLQLGARTTLHAINTGAVATVHAVGYGIGFTLRTIGQIILFIWRVVTFPFVAIGHGVEHVFGATSSSLASVIQPKNTANVPVITPEQAQQATLIQKDTLAVTPVKPTGSGGACDSGAGNGGYPVDWCNARMDTMQTVSYSSDHINRECTSYAYWYFTTIEGHTNFYVTGNANRWARTSNYPAHAAPAVGGIAVETGGYYGHVAIVQALPGQTYDGKVVPDGYVLVSEMNYDWQGHFRYSYSPLSKFSSYIYP
ncbi:MAG: CHAP domain-containing protein [Candidatus Saccharibacteria bacterium]